MVDCPCSPTVITTTGDALKFCVPIIILGEIVKLELTTEHLVTERNVIVSWIEKVGTAECRKAEVTSYWLDLNA